MKLVDCICDEGLFINDLYFLYVVETFITLNWKASYKYMSPVSSLSLEPIHLFLSIDF